MGCDVVQGYLIAKPMPLEDLLVFLKSLDVRQPYGDEADTAPTPMVAKA